MQYNEELHYSAKASDVFRGFIHLYRRQVTLFSSFKEITGKIIEIKWKSRDSTAIPKPNEVVQQSE